MFLKSCITYEKIWNQTLCDVIADIGAVLKNILTESRFPYRGFIGTSVYRHTFCGCSIFTEITNGARVCL